MPEKASVGQDSEWPYREHKEHWSGGGTTMRHSDIATIHGHEARRRGARGETGRLSPLDTKQQTVSIN